MEKNLWLKDRYYNLLVFYQNQPNQLTDSEKRELSSYKIILENQFYYNQRDLYISFIEEYLRENAGTDGTGLFIYEFFALYRKSGQDLRALEAEVLETGISKLNNFSIDSASTAFADLVEDLFGECEAQTDKESEMPDYQFRSLIRSILSEMIPFSS